MAKKTLNSIKFPGLDDEYEVPGSSAVSYEPQELTEEQKAQGRQNLGAGTSNFSGSYNDLAGKPEIPGKYTLPAAASEALGGVKADPAQNSDTQPVRIGADGKLVTAPGGASDAQVSTAVTTWLTNHPEATTTVQDGTITGAKLSDDLYKQVMGNARHKLTEVEVTPELQGGDDWVKANYDGSEYKVATTFFTPLTKTPRYIKVVNKTSSTTIKLRSGHTKFRFANGADPTADDFAVAAGHRNLQFFNNISIAPGETLLYDLQEYGRKGREYFQFIISPAAIGGAYTDAQFSAKLREQAEFYYVYDSYVPTLSP